jgi:hypothetical protein
MIVAVAPGGHNETEYRADIANFAWSPLAKRLRDGPEKIVMGYC